MDSSVQNQRPPKLLTSQTSQYASRPSQKRSQDQAVTKFEITKDDLEKLSQFRETFEKGKDFLERSKLINVVTPITSPPEQLLSPPSNRSGVLANKKSTPA
jgi:hypothetical protein